MRRFMVPVLVVAVLLVSIGVASIRPSVVAQEATPSGRSMADHPLVGAWVVDISAEDPTGPQEATMPPNVSVFTDEGTVLNGAPGAGTDVGAWQATGPRSAAMTFIGLIDEEDFAGSVVIRGTIDVDATGETFSGPYSYTVVASDGTVVDAGRDMARGTRITVEPIEAEGTPAAAVPTWMPEAAAVSTPTP